MGTSIAFYLYLIFVTSYQLPLNACPDCLVLCNNNGYMYLNNYFTIYCMTRYLRSYNLHENFVFYNAFIQINKSHAYSLYSGSCLY